jgi:uncharacterized protein
MPPPRPPLPPPTATVPLPVAVAHPQRTAPAGWPPRAPAALQPAKHTVPPRRRSSGGVLLAAVLVVALITVVGIVGLAAAISSRSARTAEPGYEQYQPSAAPRTPVWSSATPAGTTARPIRSTSTPPPQPRPVPLLGDNPIFGGGLSLGAVDCPLPGFSTDPRTQAGFYRAALDCLNRAWLPVLSAAGLPFESPRIEVPTGPFNTSCGNRAADVPAFYCEGTIYMTPRYFSEIERLPANDPGPFLGVLAHEYGHHVQELSGVMDAAWERRYEAGVGSPTDLEISRRNELLATCFGGMFFASSTGRGSVTRAMLDAAGRDQADRGDRPERGQPRDHGTPANNGAWFNHGVRLNRTHGCNTWLAPAGSVS